MAESEYPVPGVDVPGKPEQESRFTSPTTLCPRPQEWHSTDGDSTEVEVSELAYGLVRALQPVLCVETGTGFGQTTWQIVAALGMNGHGSLLTFETDHERCQQFRADPAYVAANRQSLVKLIEGDVHGWRGDGRTVEFAWIDSFYESRVPDFLHLRQFMRIGSIAVFHDTAPGHGSHRIPSGRDLRNELYAELLGVIRLVNLPTPRGLTIAEVIA